MAEAEKKEESQQFAGQTEESPKQQKRSVETKVSLDARNEYKIPTATGQSQVYTATKDTLFSKPKPNNQAMALEWVFGMNPTIPVFSLQDHDKLVVLYAGANNGIIYNHTLKSQYLLQGHTNPISCMSVSEDRRWIATADRGLDNLVVVWDSYTGIPVQTYFDSHVTGVIDMCFSSDSKYLATLGFEEPQWVCIWNWTNEDQEPVIYTTLDTKFGLQSYIIFKPGNNTQLLSTSKSHVLFYHWTTENLHFNSMKLKRFQDAAAKSHGSDEFPKPSPDDTTTIHITNVSLRRAVFHLKRTEILVAISSSIVFWDVGEYLRDYETLPSLKHNLIRLQDNVITFLTTNDEYIVTGDICGHIYFYDEDLRVLTWYTEFKLDAIISISFSSELSGEYIMDCSLEAKPITIRNFIVSTLSCKIVHKTLSKNPKIFVQEDFEALYAMACHPKLTAVAMGNQNGVLKMWDYNVKAILIKKVFEEEKKIRSLAFDPRGDYLAVGFDCGAVHILDGHTLIADAQECFRHSTESIHLITFSSDSRLLATADAGKAVTVFYQQRNLDSYPCWMYLGRYVSHYKPIKDLLFGVQQDNPLPRLLSLGMDRQLVEYDLERSTVNELFLLSTDHVEQSAEPLCMTWYPPITQEEFLLTGSDQYKFKLFNSTTKMCRKTLLGPTFGSPIKKIDVLPKQKGIFKHNDYLAYITDDKVGLQILPLDGNPFKSSAVVCHPAGVSVLSCSNDGKFLYTSGGADCSVCAWEINLSVLEATAALGGQDMLPFYTLLDGGKHGQFYKDMEDIFYYCLTRFHGTEALNNQVSAKCSLSDVPCLMRTLGYFPSEKEIEDMINEVKFSMYAETSEYVTDIDLEDFIKLYVNHRPAFGLSADEIAEAFAVLGEVNEHGQHVLQRKKLLEVLQIRGECMTEDEMVDCFVSLLGLNEEGEDGASLGENYSLKDAIPPIVSAETFITYILGLPPLGNRRSISSLVRSKSVSS